MIREIKGYFWGNGDLPVKRDDHAMDELRYYIMHISKPKTEKQVKSDISKNKERLIRMLRRK